MATHHFPSITELELEASLDEHLPFAFTRILIDSLPIENATEVAMLLGKADISEQDIPVLKRTDFFKLLGVLEYASIKIGVPERLACLLSNHYSLQLESAPPKNWGTIFQNAYDHFHTECCKYKKSRFYGNKVFNMMEYIENHAADKLSISQMSKVFHYNPSYLCQKFHSETGKTVYRYYMECKLGEAATLLTQTERSLNDIASFLHFSSQSHFQRAFNQYYHISPGQWRTEHRE